MVEYVSCFELAEGLISSFMQSRHAIAAWEPLFGYGGVGDGSDRMR